MIKSDHGHVEMEGKPSDIAADLGVAINAALKKFDEEGRLHVIGAIIYVLDHTDEGEERNDGTHYS